MSMPGTGDQTLGIQLLQSPLKPLPGLVTDLLMTNENEVSIASPDTHLQ